MGNTVHTYRVGGDRQGLAKGGLKAKYINELHDTMTIYPILLYFLYVWFVE